jgi:hypothetical protein
MSASATISGVIRVLRFAGTYVAGWPRCAGGGGDNDGAHDVDDADTVLELLAGCTACRPGS